MLKLTELNRVLCLVISTAALPVPLAACEAPSVADEAAQAEAVASDSQAEAGEDAAVEAWLDKLQDKSAQIKTLRAKLVYDKIDSLVGDKQRRFGTLAYEAGPPARFAVHFDRRLTDGNRSKPQDRWYVFDGRWLVERLDDEKQFRKYEVVAPDAKPQDADPLALGEGPFAVPVNFNKQRVQSRFDVKLVEPSDDDPADTFHLLLTPKPDRKDDVVRIDLWYGRQTLLPHRAATLNQSEVENVIDLSDVEPDAEIDEALFDTRAPSEKGDRGWLEETHPWEEK